MSASLPILDRRPLAPSMDERPVVWVKNESECYACLASATHEIKDRGGWLPVCDRCDVSEES